MSTNIATPGFIDFDVIQRYFSADNYITKPPTFEQVLMANIGIIGTLIFISLLTQLGIYLVWKKIFGKKDLWQAFVPFLNLFKLFRAVNVNPYLSLVVCIPVIGLFPLIIFNFYLPRAFNLKSPVYSIFAVLVPWLMLIILGLDQKYEYIYVKGKNTPFADSFHTPIPGEANYNSAMTPNEVGAVGSQISQAAALNAENNRKLREEYDKQMQIEAEQKAAEAAASRAKIHAENLNKEVSYDIFDNGVSGDVNPVNNDIQQG